MTIHDVGLTKRKGLDKRSWAEIGAEFGKTGEQMRNVTRKRVHNAGKHHRFLQISDLHVPFHRQSILDDLRNCAGRVDTLVFGGDEQDCYSISKFPKSYRVHFGEELIETSDLIVAIIEMLSPLRVIFVTGNHNRRLLRYLKEHVSDDVLSLFPDTNLDLIVNEGITVRDRKKGVVYRRSALRERLPHVEIVYDACWYTQVGGTIFCHPDSYKGGNLNTVTQAVKFFHDIGKTFDCVVMGHTHQLGLTYVGNVAVAESGCLCKQGDFTESKMSRPWQPGFVLLTHDEYGNVIRDKIHLKAL